MKIPVMLRAVTRKTGKKSRDLPALLFLLIIFVSGSLLSDIIGTYLHVTLHNSPFSHKPIIYGDSAHNKPERERVRDVYAAVKFLDSEFSSSYTRSLTHQVAILTTREFYTKPRPLTCNNCNEMDFKLLREPVDLCSGDEWIDLLVQITTAPMEIKGRKAVRDTWGSLTRGNTGRVRYMFLFGASYNSTNQDIVDKEHKKYKDILQYDYRDSYYNLTYKVITGFRWGAENCFKAQFILRTATDNFINLPSLIQYLRKYHNKLQRIQMGRVYPVMPRFRYRNSKFYVPDIEYPNSTYPRFAVGSAYVYSMNAVMEILEAAPHIPFFALEDVWFGLVMKQIKMRSINFDGFEFTPHLNEIWKIPHGACPRNGSFFAVHIPWPYLIRNVRTEPYQFLYWMWKACDKYDMSRRID